MPWSGPRTHEDFEAAAQTIWIGLPEEFRAALGDVTVEVADFADAETLAAMDIRDPYDLLGLYHGVGLPSKSVWDPAPFPDRIFLYRLPILDYARRNGEPVRRVIRHVLIHEIGHHFGFSDDDMDAIESGP
ncbi:metallopeptidase family protein [Rhodomicrobium sp. Az07]|uniref:metallopeptidase family protein n=1 Tax=Rhodomicrobium sp. Az07 TaxID=2839034 RepID=UPI001BEC9B7C|nr:metallopeptidase family protein [Rhodomicrobium sp. Az07]MBT3069834.1 metallopeptidase family protein [Rhodomicrobium sp. Az07]